MLLTRSDDRFAAQLERHGLAALDRRVVTTLQLNLGRLCNQSCRHCHVDAGPSHTELMSDSVLDRVLELLAASPSVTSVDITGGAPELNPRFRKLVTAVRAAGRSVMVRCNLTVIFEPGQADLPEFYAAQAVHIVASLPCYTADNVDQQRGGGVYQLSIKALKTLNAVGYGSAESLPLDLVYNPLGPHLPPPQQALEADYRARLADDHGIVFSRLFTIANMPIHRFANDLARQGKLESYSNLLDDSFNPAAVDSVMCKDLVNVDWNGRLADCDFHQMLDLPLGAGPTSIFELESFDVLSERPVTTASHCLGCTAGQGSSCGGALTNAPPPGGAHFEAPA
jgi:radical SAM/Cys-rich protein